MGSIDGYYVSKGRVCKVVGIVCHSRWFGTRGSSIFVFKIDFLLECLHLLFPVLSFQRGERNC